MEVEYKSDCQGIIGFSAVLNQGMLQHVSKDKWSALVNNQPHIHKANLQTDGYQECLAASDLFVKAQLDVKIKALEL